MEKVREARVIYKARGFHTERESYASDKLRAATGVKWSTALLGDRITRDPAQHSFIDRCPQTPI